ncbi:hydrocephalus-inducing protein-like [Pungitius pungitius]|uniref:hydrocephalus-inducing protein-like n=1 Tax=Pungitius pungitius TaxID=134920 RepID=UPI002E166DD9
MNNLFYCNRVKVRNKGRIDAPFRLSSRDTTIGRCFSFCPEEGVLPSGACQNVEVIFCSHTLGTFTEDLLLTVTGRPQPLTVTFRCVVPAIVVETPVLNFQRCFLDHRYEQKVQLTNTGPLPACYGVLDQEYEESPSLLIGSSTPTGMIRPHSSEEFPVFLLAKAVGLYASLCLAASSHPRSWEVCALWSVNHCFCPMGV